MIREFRKYTTGVVSKILMFGLAASFVLWGIGDVFRSSAQGNYIVRIAGHSITPQEFQQQMNAQLANYRQLLGDDYSPEIVKKLGLPRQVLSEMANRLLLRTEAEALGITLSDDTIMKIISQNKSFLGPKGFDKDTFHTTLQRAGLNEDAYITSLRNDSATNLLLEVLDGSVLIQRPALEALYRLHGESREATLYLFSSDSIGTLKTPDDKTLQSYFEANKDFFTVPEYRQIGYVKLMPSTLRESIKTSDSALRKLYEKRKDEFLTPEKRKVLQLLYNTKDEALSAHTLLVQGQSFSNVAKKMPPSNKELSLGYLTQADLIEESRDTVFGLEKGSFSNPVETTFGWHIFMVEDIKAPVIPGFDEIKDQLRNELVDSKAEDALYNLSVEIGDRLAGGQKLEDVAKEMKLDFSLSPFFNQSGKSTDAKEVALPPVKNLMTQTFNGDLESTSEFQLGTDGQYYFVSLANIQPAKLPKLETVRDEVLAHWKKETLSSKLAQKVQKIATSLRKGDIKPLEGVAYRTKPTGKLLRDTTPEVGGAPAPSLPLPLRHEIFVLAKNKFSQAYLLDNGEWAIAKLDTVHPMEKAKVTDADLAALKNELSEQYSEELVQYYLAYLSKKYPVDVNEAALNSLLQ